MPKNKNILVCISGLTPQIVTETLYALSIQKNIQIDEIFIITTKRGKEVILGTDKDKKTPDVKLSAEIANLSKDYKIKPPKFSANKNIFIAEEESLELYDIKTDTDNILFPNKAAQLIEKLSKPNENILHVSLSGGRKSMSAHIALTLSLFARSGDKLYHILTDEKYEFGSFYPKSEDEKKALIISEIPFVRLRALNLFKIKNGIKYSELVEQTQKRLAALTENAKIIIELKKKSIKYKNRSIFLTPTQISLYMIFAESRINGEEGYLINQIKELEFAQKLKQYLSTFYNQYFDENDKKHWHKKGIEAEYFYQNRSKINKALKTFLTDEEYNLFAVKSYKEWGNTLYKINANKERIGINYE